LAQVSSYFPHQGEEDPLRGWQGSGTIFFNQCNLRCVFCQNYDISQQARGKPTPPARLAEMMLELQTAGCHNINFVTPTHVVPQILEALVIAVEGGLRLPLVYNSSGYDSLETLRLLDGVADIYMPDFKIWEPALADEYLTAEDYPDIARQALGEMHRQVGALKLDERGLAKCGVLLRHLVLPDEVSGTPQVMAFTAQQVSTDTYVNLMAQYRPAGKVDSTHYARLNRRLTALEYRDAFQAAQEMGIWRFDERKTGFWIMEF
jgi:putative pyruvate formate lyase activating enzyme